MAWARVPRSTTPYLWNVINTEISTEWRCAVVHNLNNVNDLERVLNVTVSPVERWKEVLHLSTVVVYEDLSGDMSCTECRLAVLGRSMYDLQGLCCWAAWCVWSPSSPFSIHCDCEKSNKGTILLWSPLEGYTCTNLCKLRWCYRAKSSSGHRPLWELPQWAGGL